ncbi:MAG: TatD family hydrolase [Candidatus Hydrogenedentes bacterium]|nr:TatD family hydrolase [Candidatus Hydrogenedentota bacterium]
MVLVDTHCHLQAGQFQEDREEVLARALARLDWLVVVGDDLPTSSLAADLVRDRVYATAGTHPYHASNVDSETLDELRALLARPGVIALGEIGLDYFHEYSPRVDQARAFEQQLALAGELRKPVVIHNRDADADTLAILRNHSERLPGCIMHCFGADAAFAEQCVDTGFYVSFAGNVTFPKAEKLREAARAVPLERLLVETDAPYLAPLPHRGKRCEPWHVELTARALAVEKGVSPDEFGAVTTANARRVYALELAVETPPQASLLGLQACCEQ